MSGRFMKVKRLILPTLTMVIIASQLMGCSAATPSELQTMLQQGQQIEIEIAVPAFAEQGEEKTLDWVQLDQLTTYDSFRKTMDDIMKITTFGEGSKNGICYVNLEGLQEGNSTLEFAMMNRKFIANFLDNDTANLQVEQSISSVYADVEESESMVAAINAYWNLVADSEPNYFNGGSTLNRLEAMSLLARATTQVTDEVGDSAFESAVGQSDNTDLASLVQADSYLGLSDKSLNEKTANGTITRGEYIYMLVSNVFGADRITSADTKKASFNDCKDAGDIASKEKLSEEDKAKDYYDSAELKFALSNPDGGCPSRMYQALVAAQELGILGSDTRWDEGLTKAEGIQLFIDALQAYTKINGYATDTASGTGDTSGTVVEQEKAVDTTDDSNVGGISSGINEEDIQAEITDQEDTISESDYTINPMEDTTFYALQSCNLRGGPGTDYDKVGSLSYAQEIVCNGKVEDGDKEWLVLKTEDGSTQMVSAKLVSRTKPQPQQSTNTNNSGGTSTTTPQPPASNGGGQPSGGSDPGSVGFGDPNGAFFGLPETGNYYDPNGPSLQLE